VHYTFSCDTEAALVAYSRQITNDGLGFFSLIVGHFGYIVSRVPSFTEY